MPFGVHISARLWQVLSDIIFVLMLILVAKGYTVTRGKLRKIAWIKIFTFALVFVLAYVILYLIEAEVCLDMYTRGKTGVHPVPYLMQR